MSITTIGTGQFLNLAGAGLVATDALMTTHDDLRDVIAHEAMACVYGDAGLGKTLSVNTVLRKLAPDTTYRIQFRNTPHPSDIRRELFRVLGLTGKKPSRPVEFDDILRRTLSDSFRVLVCDEAQQFSTQCFEYVRYLWDDEHTHIAVVFVGGGNCYQVLRREPMLRSRIYTWQEFKPMTRKQVRANIPAFHPIWRDADPELIDDVNESAAHGNFRNWARITRHCLDGLARTGGTCVDKDLIRWALGRLPKGKR